MMQQIKVDMERVNAAIAKSQPEYQDKVAAKQEADVNFKAIGFATPAGGIDTALLTFCTAWPKVYPVLNTGLTFAGWFLPASVVGLARGVVEAINTQLYPQLCPKA